MLQYLLDHHQDPWWRLEYEFPILILLFAVAGIALLWFHSWKVDKLIARETKPPKPPCEPGFDWVMVRGEWREVCDFCGGNCGQCGLTGRLGCEVPADMTRMGSNLGKPLK